MVARPMIARAAFWCAVAMAVPKLFVGNAAVANVGGASQTIPTAYMDAAKFSRVPPGLLYAIAKTESSRPGYQEPWPWTLNIDGQGLYYADRQSQFDALMQAVSAGRVVDIGLMQLNWKWQYGRLHSAWYATDPVYNVITAGRLLRELYDSQESNGSWAWAVGRYHRGSNAPRHQKAAVAYTARVFRFWEQL